MNVRPYIFILILQIVGNLSFAQDSTATISGFVSKADGNDTIFIQILQDDDKKIIAEKKILKGGFGLQVGSDKNINILVFAANYDTTQIFADKKQLCNGCKLILDTIRLHPKTKSLSEVIVRSEKQLIKEFPDKLVYDVESDPDAENSPLIDIMRKIPSLNVIGDDAMDVNGQGFLVIVNGRKAGVFRQSPVQVMKTFPAKLVKSVEVITSPSAKYDAEGVGAIINIVLRKKKFDGYNASIAANTSTLQSNSIVGLITLKAGRIGFNGYYAPVLSHRPETNIEQELLYTNPSNYSVYQNSAIRNKYRNFTYNNEVSFEIDSMSLLNIGYSNSIDKRKLSSSIYSTLYDAGQQPSEIFSSNTLLNGKAAAPGINVDYQRKFDEEGDKLLSISYLYEHTRYRENNDQLIDGILNAPSGFNYFGNSEKEREHTIQIDYSQPLFSNNLEMGTKAILRDNNSDYHFDMKALANPSLQNGQFRFNQNVYAAYLAYGWRGKKLSAQAGYRGEYTTVALKSLNDIRYYTSIPTAAVSYKLDAGPTLKLSYSKRIQRPGISYLNPYTDVVNNRFIREGNSMLRPENFNVFEFAVAHNKKKINQRLTLIQTFSDNTIQAVYIQQPDSVVKATFMNLGKYRYTNFQYYINHKISTSTSHTFKGNVGYRYYADNEKRLNDGWNMSVDYSFNYRSKKYFRSAFNLGYLSYTPTVFGKTQGRVYNFLLVGQDFFNRKVSVDLSFRNFFPKYLTIQSDFMIDGLQQLSSQVTLQREVRIGITYKFGKLKERVERTEKSVENDDLLKIERKENIK